jgi:cytochrome c551/c552
MKQISIISILSLCAGPVLAETKITDDFLDRVSCNQCHGEQGVGTGPTFDQITERYRTAAVQRSDLRDRILNGGAGNWQSETGGKAMPPYSNLLSVQEVDALIEWVLQGR